MTKDPFMKLMTIFHTDKLFVSKLPTNDKILYKESRRNCLLCIKKGINCDSCDDFYPTIIFDPIFRNYAIGYNICPYRKGVSK